MRLGHSDRRLESASGRNDFPNGPDPNGRKDRAEGGALDWHVAGLLLGYGVVIVLGIMLAF